MHIRTRIRTYTRTHNAHVYAHTDFSILTPFISILGRLLYVNNINVLLT